MKKSVMIKRNSLDIDTQIEYAQKIFTEVASEPIFKRLLKGHKSWAIVGGSVRDTLLSIPSESLNLKYYWPDIDIAIAKRPSKYRSDSFPLRTISNKSTKEWDLSVNHFGGLKVKIPRLGAFDIWVCGKGEDFSTDLHHWEKYLDEIDFGLNAVAFVWPLRRIVVHPNWRNDVLSLKIERLSKKIIQREIQTVRAVALLQKISKSFSSDIKVGLRVRNDIRWLATEAKIDETNRAFEYLLEKLVTRRWPLATFRKFQAVLNDTLRSHPTSDQFQLAMRAFKKGLAKASSNHLP